MPSPVFTSWRVIFREFTAENYVAVCKNFRKNRRKTTPETVKNQEKGAENYSAQCEKEAKSMTYSVEVTGTFSYTCDVIAGSEEEARRKAIEDFYNYDSTYLEFEPSQTEIWKVEQ